MSCFLSPNGSPSDKKFFFVLFTCCFVNKKNLKASAKVLVENQPTESLTRVLQNLKLTCPITVKSAFCSNLSIFCQLWLVIHPKKGLAFTNHLLQSYLGLHQSKIRKFMDISMFQSNINQVLTAFMVNADASKQPISMLGSPKTPQKLCCHMPDQVQ